MPRGGFLQPLLLLLSPFPTTPPSNVTPCCVAWLLARVAGGASLPLLHRAAGAHSEGFLSAVGWCEWRGWEHSLYLIIMERTPYFLGGMMDVSQRARAARANKMITPRINSIGDNTINIAFIASPPYFLGFSDLGKDVYIAQSMKNKIA